MKLKFLLGIVIITIIGLSNSCQNDPNDIADKRDNIVGKWHCTLDDSQVPSDYEVDITKDTADNTKIYLANFVSNGSPAYATMSGFNLTVPEQQVGNSVVSADGIVSKDYQSVTWTLKIDGDDYTAKMVPGGIAKKQQLAR